MELSRLIILIAVTVLYAVAAEKVKYNNYRVYSVAVENEKQLNLMKEIENNPDGYRFWEFPTTVGRSVDIVVPPHKIAEFQEMVIDNQMKSKMMVKDVQKLIDDEQPRFAARNGFGWTQYHSLAEINKWIGSMAEAYPDIATVEIGGSSYEGREIKGLKIVFDKVGIS
jgi:carboxypeptidase A